MRITSVRDLSNSLLILSLTRIILNFLGDPKNDPLIVEKDGEFFEISITRPNSKLTTFRQFEPDCDLLMDFLDSIDETAAPD